MWKSEVFTTGKISSFKSFKSSLILCALQNCTFDPALVLTLLRRGAGFPELELYGFYGA